MSAIIFIVLVIGGIKLFEKYQYSQYLEFQRQEHKRLGLPPPEYYQELSRQKILEYERNKGKTMRLF